MSNTSGNFFQSSLGKKLIMSLTGLFLISFLVVHCLLNAFIFANDGGLLFNSGAHFMGTNPVIRLMEYVLFLGVMQEVFKNPLVVVVYVLGCGSLAYHLMHGFQSAFQTLGLNHKKYTPLIKSAGFWFSVIVSLIFAAMPVSMFLGFIK